MASLRLTAQPTVAHDVAEEGVARKRGVLLALAAFASLTAGAVHLQLVAEDPGDWWEYVTFFLVTGVLQVVCAGVLLWRPAVWVLLTGIWGNVAILGMYIYTRTWGVPYGPEARHQELAGMSDIVVAIAEIAVVALLCTALTGRTRRVVVNLVGLIGVGLWIGRMTGVIL